MAVRLQIAKSEHRYSNVNAVTTSPVTLDMPFDSQICHLKTGVDKSYLIRMMA